MRTEDGTENDAAGLRLADLAEDVLARSRLVELPFTYEYDTWVLAQDSMRFLVALIGHTSPRKVIEYGSGLSTRVLAATLDRGSVIRSFDHVEAYAAKTRAALVGPACDVEVMHRAIGIRFFNGKLLPFYKLRRHDLSRVREADLVVVDGPPGPWGREAALHVAFPAMRNGALLLLDDAARPGELKAAEAWRQYFGDAIETELLPGVGKGLLLVKKVRLRAQGRRFTLAERLDAARHSLKALWRHRPGRRRRTQNHG